MLSSAFFGFFAHTGFLRALRRVGIAPAAYAGASAGALIAAFAASGKTLDDITDVLTRLRRADFWDPAPPWAALARGGPPGLLRGRRFAALLGHHLPVDRFEDCVAPLVTVSTNLSRRARHVDATGPLVPAVWASCALPLLFEPVRRDADLHVDGGLLDKAPIRPLVDTVQDLDAIVVHYLRSRSLCGPVPRGPWAFMDHALDLVRDDAWRHQAALAEARGVVVHVVETRPPRVTPFRLSRGAAPLAAAEQQATAALAATAGTGS